MWASRGLDGKREEIGVTKREAAIVAAYTGVLIGEFGEMHGYIEGVMGRPVWTHELGSKEVMSEIREKSKADFVAIEVV